MRAGGVALGVALALLVVLLPVPTALLDALLALNLGATSLLLLAAVGERSTGWARSLPRALLGTTLARLALEVAASRQILSRGDGGAVIRAFGEVVVRGDWAIGVAVFAILVTVQYLVVARGAERVAEVAARFSLDAMPGLQLSLDAARRAGDLDARAAQWRRDDLTAAGRFAGAMDGAMKFVRGDVIAGAVIVAVNLAGGVAVGALSRHMPLDAALLRYGVLAVGQGMVAQVPSLMSAAAAGLVVTRVDLDVADDTPLPLRWWFASAALTLLVGVAPGMPLAPFALASATLASVGAVLHRRAVREAPVLRVTWPALDAPTRRRIESARDSVQRASGVTLPRLQCTPGPTMRVDVSNVTAHDGPADHAMLRAVLHHLAAQRIGLDLVGARLDAIARTSPRGVDAVVPGRMSVAVFTEAVRALVDEGADLDALPAVIESLSRAATPLPDADAALRACRAALAPAWRAAWSTKAPSVWHVDALLESSLRDLHGRPPGASLRDDLRAATTALDGTTAPVIVVADPAARRALWEALRTKHPAIRVFAHDELAGVPLTRRGVLRPA